MISYPVNVAHTRWTIVRLSDGVTLHQRKRWPVANGGPVVGLDPDLAYLREVNNPIPGHDPRLYRVASFVVQDVPRNTVTTSHTLVRRDEADLIEAAEQEERARAEVILDVERELLQTRLVLGAVLDHLLDVTPLPPKKEALANRYITKSRRAWSNRTRLNDIVAEIEAGADPDMDAGWEV